MAALVLVAVVVLSTAVLGTGAPYKPIEVDRMPPPLPQNVATYEAIDPESTPTSEHRFIALAN
jgi:hypothetical protein